MAVAAERTIVVKGQSGSHHDEGVLATTATPGMHLSMDANGKYEKSSAAAAELVKRTVAILKEDALQGRTVSDNYAVNDLAFVYYPQSGDHLLLLVKSGQNIAVGDLLVCEGGGTGLFVKAAGTEAAYKAQALMSSGGALGSNGLIKCRWIGL